MLNIIFFFQQSFNVHNKQNKSSTEVEQYTMMTNIQEGITYLQEDIMDKNVP
jgi:hypothetical protein